MSRFPHTYCSQCGLDLGPGDAGVSSCSDHAPQHYEMPTRDAALAARIHDLLWGLHPECCGRPEVGASYGGQQELVCCGCPNADRLNDAQIVAALRAMFPESGGVNG